MRLKLAALAAALVASMVVGLTVTSADAVDNPNVLKVVRPVPPAGYFVGDSIDIDANFSVSAKWKLSLWSDGGTGTWAKVPGFTGITATSSGNHTFTNFVVTKAQKVQVRIDPGTNLATENVTNELDLTPQPVVIGVPGTDGTLNTPAPTYIAGDKVSLTANFASGTRSITLWSDASGSWLPATGGSFSNQTSNSSGDKTFSYPVTGEENVQARTSTGLLTNIVHLSPLPTSGTLDPITGSGKTVTAHFLPARNGQATSLQAMTIKTSNTDEVTTPGWKTIATSKQNSTGDTTFSVSDPLEVKHTYRAVSGATDTNSVDFAAPLPSVATGLSQVYFNSNEGDSVNTRTRYFEGEFSMSGSTKNASPQGTPCAAISTVTKSTMKGRGNYSWSFDKKSFTLKTDKAKNLCGMGSSKKWALVANHYDKSLLRNTVADNLASKFSNLAWTPKSVPVDLFVNGSYRGSYILIERIEIQNPKADADPDKVVPARVDIDELKSPGQLTDPTNPNNVVPNITGGYILEWDFRKGADNNISVGSRGWAGLKDPENDLDEDGNPTGEGVSKQQVSYINGYLDDADAALFGSNFTSDTSGWKKYINIDSAVDYYLAMEFMKPIDGNMWASVYMYKPRGGKLEFGPMWDFDLSSGSADRAGNAVSPSGWYLRNPLGISAMQSSKTWFNRLNEDPDFRAAVKARWNAVYPTLSSTSFIAAQKALISDSASENFTKWSHSEKLSSVEVVKSSWSADVQYLSDWMSSRRSWMNSQF
jgi:hypothetical protein